MNTFDLLQLPLALCPDAIALRFEDGVATFDELQTDILRLAGGMRRLGVGPGTVVGAFDVNSDRYVQLLYAANYLGATFAPLNYRARPGELSDLLATAGVEILYAGSRYAPVVTEAIAEGDGVRAVVSLDDGWSDVPAFEAHLPAEPLDPEDTADMDDAAPAIIMFTAGTTSRPKGVPMSFGAFWGYVTGTTEPPSDEPQAIQLICAPFYHIGGLSAVMSGPYTGRQMVILPQFDEIEWLETVQRLGVTHAFLVPTMVKRLIDHPDFGKYDLGSLSILTYGAAPMPPGVLLRALDLFPSSVGFMNAYGQTETTATVSILGPDDHRLEGSTEEIERKKARLLSIGKPLDDVELKIVDADRNPLPIGEIGEVALRTARAMKGYLPREGAAVDTGRVDNEGWLFTSDLGWIDEDGYVFLAGRQSDLIIRGGENISPAEVEAVLYRHPAVEDVAVFGVPDEEWGEQVVAAVIQREGIERPSDEALIGFCRDHLTSFKKPSRIEWLDELPVSPLGKVLKTELRRIFDPAAAAAGA